MRCRAFTLIELLVVVAIIVVLLALLVPAMDKAIYQAELAVCGARLKSVAQAAIQYAASAKRTYPYRSVIKRNSGQPSRLIAAWPTGYFDDRFIFSGYLNTEAMLCPLSAGFDIDATRPEASDNVFSGYSLWFQFRYTNTTYGAMDKIGQQFTWKPVVDEDRL